MTDAQRRRQETAARLSAGYAELAAAPDRRRDERITAGFKPDPRMERLIELRRTDRAAFDVAVRGLGMSLGYYEGAKSAHDRLRETDDA